MGKWEEFKLWILTSAIHWMLRFIWYSLRIKWYRISKPNRVIYAIWHANILPAVYVYRSEKIAILVSPHRDGELANRILQSMGYHTVRGATDDQAVPALLRILKLNNISIAITPDGPRGPRHVVKSGVVKLAKWLKIPIVPISVECRPCYRLSSWDRFLLPIPFARCIIKEEGLIHVKDETHALRELTDKLGT